MTNEKISRIQALDGEVKGFHPVLRSLFDRLPNVTSVEYRQGSREMGADFVIEKADPTLLTSEYVGVIVKVGKVKQDHHEVERQIEECELERTYGAGKKKIFLTEVWVVSNDTISQGAQDKIHHKYKNKSIKFISGERIVQLIDKFFPEYWTDVTLKIGEYFRAVDLAASHLASGRSLLGDTAPSVHVEQHLHKIEKASLRRLERRHKAKSYSLEAALQEGRLILIESGMGSGKSTLIANYARKLASPEEYNSSGTIPVIISAKDLRDIYSQDLSALVDTVLGKVDVDVKSIVVFVDAWDELHLQSDEQISFVNSIKSALDLRSDTFVVIASRPVAPELDAVIERNFVRFNLKPFSVKQVISLVDAICASESVRSRLLKDLEKSKLFKVLPKTPISAILLAKLLKENVHEIPSTMTELYGKYMELVMGRWDMTKGLQSQTEYEVIHSVAVNLARFVIDNSLDSISIEDARQIFDDYVDSRNLKIDSSAVFELLSSKDEVFSMSRDLGLISFRHRTFAEYFYAVGIDRDGTFDVSSEVFDPYWNTIYFFYFGIRKDSEYLVRRVSELSLVEPDSRFARLLMLPNMLLAAYLTPYSAIVEAVRRYFEDATSVYLDVVRGEDPESPFSNFSHLQLLCLITNVASGAYAYEFFLKALRECAIDFYSAPMLDQERSMVSLFLVNSALLTSGESAAYDTFLENYGPSIPLPLRVGVVEHSGAMGVRSDAVEKYTKRFLKSVRDNQGMRSSISALFDKSIISGHNLPPRLT